MYIYPNLIPCKEYGCIKCNWCYDNCEICDYNSKSCVFCDWYESPDCFKVREGLVDVDEGTKSAEKSTET